MKQVVTIVFCQDFRARAWVSHLVGNSSKGPVNWFIKGEKCLQNVVKSHWPVGSHQAGHPCGQGRAMEPLRPREEPGSLAVGQSLISHLGTLSFPQRSLEWTRWGRASCPPRASTKTPGLEPGELGA